MKSELIYAYSGKSGKPYDIRKHFGIDNSLLQDELPVLSGNREDWRETQAQKRLEELGLSINSYPFGGFDIVGYKIGEFEKAGPYKKFSGLDSVMRREIYKTDVNGVYVFSDFLVGINREPIETLNQEAFSHEMYTKFLSELHEMGRDDLKMILDRMRKIQAEPVELMDF